MSERAVQPWCNVGHVTRDAERTGCTVVMFDRIAPTVVDVRGGAPGTRETDVLGPGRLVGKADAVVLAGGSAFGLAAADGVMRYLAEHGRGFETVAGGVPIVPAAVIFDLSNGIAAYPSAADGYQAASNASPIHTASGRLGAGTGATVAKLGGSPQPAGLGIATVNCGDADVTAIVVLNAVGDVRDPATGAWLAQTRDASGAVRSARAVAVSGRGTELREGEHTTIGVVLVSRAVSRDALYRCCISAHDALARCIIPAHTVFDGDTFFAAAPQTEEVDALTTLRLATAAEMAVEQAITSIFA